MEIPLIIYNRNMLLVFSQSQEIYRWLKKTLHCTEYAAKDIEVLEHLNSYINFRKTLPTAVSLNTDNKDAPILLVPPTPSLPDYQHTILGMLYQTFDESSILFVGMQQESCAVCEDALPAHLASQTATIYLPHKIEQEDTDGSPLETSDQKTSRPIFLDILFLLADSVKEIACYKNNSAHHLFQNAARLYESHELHVWLIPKEVIENDLRAKPNLNTNYTDVLLNCIALISRAHSNPALPPYYINLLLKTKQNWKLTNTELKQLSQLLMGALTTLGLHQDANFEDKSESSKLLEPVVALMHKKARNREEKAKFYSRCNEMLLENFY